MKNGCTLPFIVELSVSCTHVIHCALDDPSRDLFPVLGGGGGDDGGGVGHGRGAVGQGAEPGDASRIDKTLLFVL